jgi:Cys-rich protein (TIGR01571 family)
MNAHGDDSAFQDCEAVEGGSFRRNDETTNGKKGKAGGSPPGSPPGSPTSPDRGKSSSRMSSGFKYHCLRPLRSSWITCWSIDDEYRTHMPPRHSDYRDKLPEPIEFKVDEYERFIRPGEWTFGLLDMWCPKSKVVKHSVHVPCWDSFKLLPWKWRGCVFGRNCRECYWFGLRETRWARAAYAGNLGREYLMPVRGVGTHGYKSEIEALCWMTWILGCLMGCGIGQILSICGNASVNFAAPYTCHTRSRMRYKYGLPPAIPCCPLGIDDYLVHCFCFYCASHQEMRELAVRGVDGPGLHTMDLHPTSYAHLEGYEEALEQRRRKVQLMWLNPPPEYKLNTEYERHYPDAMSAVGHSVVKACKLTGRACGQAVTGRTEESIRGELKQQNTTQLGWNVGMTAPVVQEMRRKGHERTNSDPTMVPVIQETDPYLSKAWSVAY